jgi:hypothetical protein
MMGIKTPVMKSLVLSEDNAPQKVHVFRALFRANIKKSDFRHEMRQHGKPHVFNGAMSVVPVTAEDL